MCPRHSFSLVAKSLQSRGQVDQPRESSSSQRVRLASGCGALVVEAATSDELSENRRPRHVVGRDAHDAIEKAQQPERGGVSGVRAWYFEQVTFSVNAQHTELINQGRVEHRVGVRLIGVNVASFAGPHLGPTRDGLSRVEAT